MEEVEEEIEKEGGGEVRIGGGVPRGIGAKLMCLAIKP